MRMGSDSKAGLRPRGFTLIELLVVIMIIVLLIGILLPGLGKTRKLAALLREESFASQQGRAFHTYMVTNRDKVLIGAPHWNWAHGASNEIFGMTPGDPINRGRYLEGSISKIWTWHFFGSLDYKLDAIQFDKKTFAEFWTRPKETGSGVWHSPGSNSFHTALAYHPSFGYNGIFLGGAYTHGAFLNARPGPNPRPQGGGYFLDRADQVRYPDKLVTFASARGGDVREGSWWNWGTGNPDSGIIRPGYWLIRAPRPHPNARGSHSIGGGWNASNVWRPNAVPSTWGNLDMRHFNKTVTIFFDGHVEPQTIEELRDMRKWSNYADRADWNFQPGP